ncbi:hypothetical protein Ais01nite_47790 [Asanoa ishikariensis]|uniref:Uncharacterized protein n=1 Tax=Asanoa ishikariensis TaxID=137265 RepID=A0A1H3RWG6_9ACTN|nr:hypothetical protein [Asanoa ishikariensis]GIF66744.1 hypothetical protein Ais01nite_47790 [Asanoa ishikariensis]SDZ30063.1 hypothetical protein SAMN05421684_4306 [Asanoa ishikariensis]
MRLWHLCAALSAVNAVLAWTVGDNVLNGIAAVAFGIAALALHRKH